MGDRFIYEAALQPVDKISSTKNYKLGTLLSIDERVWAYAKAGATALAAGKLTQATAPDSNVVNVTVAAAAAIGATEVTLDAGDAITAGTFNDGFLQINDATGEAQNLRIKSHTGVAAAGEITVKLYDYDAVKVALVADTSECSLVKNDYADTIVAPTTLTGKIVGYPNVAVTAAYYYWSQVDGTVNGLINGTPAVGARVIPSATTAGAVDVISTGAIAQPVVGEMKDVGVSTEYKPIKLSLAY